MAQPPLQLVIGNYNTSSWSLRAWLAMRLARLAFTEIRIPLRRADTPAAIRRHSPSGKLPVLIVDGLPVWDSLSIAELIAELEPRVWPLDAAQRAEARSISAEMHSGFVDLRRLMPMDMVSRFAPPGRMPRGLTSDIMRVSAIWRGCRERHAADGPFLFGAFSLADAMMAPVASRFVTHAVPLDPMLDDYVDSVMSWPDMVVWRDAAAGEVQELEEGRALEARSVARGGREISDESAEPLPPPVMAIAEPPAATQTVPQPVGPLDEVPEAAPEAPADSEVELPEPPKPEPPKPEPPKPEPLYEAEDDGERLPSFEADASPPREAPPADPPPVPVDPPPAATASRPRPALPAEPLELDRPFRPAPEAVAEQDGHGEPPRRPPATTIKPIGSGILRRR